VQSSVVGSSSAVVHCSKVVSACALSGDVVKHDPMKAQDSITMILSNLFIFYCDIFILVVSIYNPSLEKKYEDNLITTQEDHC
jgi:hypothetical protein